MKNIIRKFKSPLLASLIFISVLFIQEFVLRFVLPDFNPNHHIRFNKSTDTSPALGVKNATFRLVKNSGDYNVTVRFNEHGFRDTWLDTLAGFCLAAELGKPLFSRFGQNHAFRICEEHSEHFENFQHHPK